MLKIKLNSPGPQAEDVRVLYSCAKACSIHLGISNNCPWAKSLPSAWQAWFVEVMSLGLLYLRSRIKFLCNGARAHPSSLPSALEQRGPARFGWEGSAHPCSAQLGCRGPASCPRAGGVRHTERFSPFSSFVWAVLYVWGVGKHRKEQVPQTVTLSWSPPRMLNSWGEVSWHRHLI